jgi:DNA polymerase III epsilon subunit-like protein
MNKQLIFFDTETTGNTNEDYLCQIAYKSSKETFNELYLPPKRIPPEASAVHHITNKMVADKPPFRESDTYQKVKDLFEDDGSVLVAHNAIFDMAMIEREGIKPKAFICTLRLARHLDPEGKIERYNLQYLRYLLEIEVDATAHDALGDVIVLEELYKRLYKKMERELSFDKSQDDSEQILNRMIEISSRPSMIRTFKFGKYNGKAVEEVARIDPGYLRWLYEQKKSGDQIDEDWIYTLEQYLK